MNTGRIHCSNPMLCRSFLPKSKWPNAHAGKRSAIIPSALPMAMNSGQSTRGRLTVRIHSKSEGREEQSCHQRSRNNPLDNQPRGVQFRSPLRIWNCWRREQPPIAVTSFLPPRDMDPRGIKSRRRDCENRCPDDYFLPGTHEPSLLRSAPSGRSDLLHSNFHQSVSVYNQYG